MNSLERAAFYEQLSEIIEEIDAIFKEHGYDPKTFDIDELEDFTDDLGHVYQHVHRLKADIE